MLTINRETLELVLTVLATVLASSGFWAYFTKRTETRSLQNRLLLGLAHDRIICLGMAYVFRGWITQDEYENLIEYLYKPYKDMGGNGTAERIIQEVNRLPINKYKIETLEVSKNDHSEQGV